MSTSIVPPGAAELAAGVTGEPLSRARPRVVLDSNICLDLFLFKDSGCAALTQALDAGRLEAVTRADCREEWLRVLGYRSVPIHPPQRPLMRQRYDEVITLLGDEAFDPQAAASLPVCRDPDDQMFLQLTQAAGARWLLTKDKQLLKLNRKTVKAGLFRIMLPCDWTSDLIDA